MPLLLNTSLPYDLASLPSGKISPLEASTWIAHAPDRHLVWGQKAPEACCSLWWQQVPAWPKETLGLIGHFQATDEASARSLLKEACRVLATMGCTMAVGPMDGCTWHSYRLMTDPGDFPPFLFDLQTPPSYPAWWKSAGFHTFQTYHSDVTDELRLEDPRLARVKSRLEKGGIEISTVKEATFDKDLKKIFAVSLKSFQQNVLYTPLKQEAFLALYCPAGPLMNAGLSLLAEGPEGPEGFIFTVVDPKLQLPVIKTLAVIRKRSTAGLGKVLLQECQHLAYDKGYRQAVHALMHDQNSSTLMGEGRCIRRYALFAKGLR